jgi:hypothetical protein
MGATIMSRSAYVCSAAGFAIVVFATTCAFGQAITPGDQPTSPPSGEPTQPSGQPTAQPPGQEPPLPPVVVSGTRIERSAEDLPVSATVIPREHIVNVPGDRSRRTCVGSPASS